MAGSRLSPAEEKDRLETFATQRKLLTLNPPMRILYVLVSVCAFTIVADSNARCYWLSANAFLTE